MLSRGADTQTSAVVNGVNGNWLYWPPVVGMDFQAFSAQDPIGCNSVGMVGGFFEATADGDAVGDVAGNCGTAWDHVGFYNILGQIV